MCWFCHFGVWRDNAKLPAWRFCVICHSLATQVTNVAQLIKNFFIQWDFKQDQARFLRDSSELQIKKTWISAHFFFQILIVSFFLIDVPNTARLQRTNSKHHIFSQSLLYTSWHWSINVGGICTPTKQFKKVSARVEVLHFSIFGKRRFVTDSRR